MKAWTSGEMDTLWMASILFLGLSALFYCYKKWKDNKRYPKYFRIDGKVVLITGANSGIGKETAIELAERGANVIMACKDRNLAEIAQLEIITKSGNPNVQLMIVDLASFESIRSFVNDFVKKVSHLDILINNAGIFGVKQSLTDDGLEMHMGVNYFGHFLLTLLLLDRIKQSKYGRIINVSSSFHNLYKLNKNNWNSENYYSFLEAYSQSKLATVMFTIDLANFLKNTRITVNAVHPGYIYSDIHKGFSSNLHIPLSLCNVVAKFYLQSSKWGAQSIVYLVVDKNLESITGQYFNQFNIGSISKDAMSEDNRKWLWQKSVDITGVNIY